MTILTINKEQILKYGKEFISLQKGMKCPTCRRKINEEVINKEDFKSYIITKALREIYY